MLGKRGTILTNSSDVYAEPCAQHLLAMIASLARALPIALDAQRGDRSWRMSLRPTLPLLNGQTVLLLGFGAIARRLVELLHPLEMNVMAVRRHIRGDESIRVVTVSELDQLLPTVDHLVNTLPANDQSKDFVNAARLAKLKAGAIVYNIGRGTTLDQDALIRELRPGRLSAAYLDVANPEPLPPDHPLWAAPNRKRTTGQTLPRQSATLRTRRGLAQSSHLRNLHSVGLAGCSHWPDFAERKIASMTAMFLIDSSKGTAGSLSSRIQRANKSP